MKILVIQTGKLGDMVCTTPVFRAIKQKFPEADLIVAGDALNREVLKGNPHVNEYVVSSTLSDKDVRDIDIAVLLTPNPSILWKLLRVRVRRIIVPKIVGGFSPYATKKYRLLSLFATRVPHRMGHYAPQEYLNMLAPLGVLSTDTTKELFYTEEARRAADRLVGGDGRYKVAISPSAGNKIKNWGAEKFAIVAEALARDRQAHIYVIGTERDRAEVEATVSRLGSSLAYTNLLGGLSVDELKAFIARMDLFIAVDTGPIYIAEAFRVATVDIVGPMDEREQPPSGPRHRLVYLKDRTAPQLHIMNARMYDEREARRQIEDITAEMVIAPAKELLV